VARVTYSSEPRHYLPVLLRAAALAILLGVPLPAAAVTIDFDDLAAMVNSPGDAVPMANRLSTELLASVGVAFTSVADFVAVVVHAPDLTTSMPNVIGGVNSAGGLSYGSPVFISFFDPADPTAKAVTDFVSIRGDRVPVADASATMEAFDANGGLLGFVTAPDSEVGLTLSLSIPGIHMVRLTQDSASTLYDGTIGFDDLTFNPVQAIPEPPRLALVLTGLTSLGLGGRRRAARG